MSALYQINMFTFWFI